MSKFDALKVSDWRPWTYDNAYEVQPTTGPSRLAIGSAGQQADVFLALAHVLRSPFAILYVLHTPRTTQLPGRYQSPPLELAAVGHFFRAHSLFFASDGRHDVWLRSHPDSATLVWDRHDVLYAYGPLELFEDVLRAHGIQRGNVVIPSPHAHNYHDSWDSSEKAVLAAFPWTLSPLHPEDEQ